MQNIQVLSQTVADQIAAGEVAERPASVVKELVENSIDAGAHHIDVEIKQGGVSYIRVTDDGSGIPAAQAKTAFLRHATSKLSTIDDLDHIATMGFRGEALASICAVAEVEVITKTADAEEGCYLELVHGLPKEQESIACANGTTMIVKRLFSNVPARMKFLKKNATEAGYVADVLGRIALSRPEIAFTYTCDGKEVFSTVGDGNLTNVVLNLYGLDHAKAVIPIDYTEGMIRITGLLGKPELARGNRTRQTLFVNGRYIKNHVLAKVAEEAYRNAMMVGRFPFFVLQITLPPEQVDVNVHPAKTEVKFANEKQVYDVAYHAMRRAIYHDEEPAQPVQNVPMPAKTSPSSVLPTTDHSRRSSSFEKPVAPTLVRQYLENTIPPKEESPKTETHLKEPDSLWDEILTSPPEPTQKPEPVQEVLPGFSPEEDSKAKPPTQIVGQIFDTYIVCQSGEEMFLIDQHAAHERLRFEALREAYLKKERLAQILLTPMVLHLEQREKQIILDSIKDFFRFGFELEDFGGNSIIVHGTPISADEKTIGNLILELAEAFGEQRRHPVADFEERALDMISCKYAIKANHRLSLPEMQDLVKRTQHLESDGVKTCPHGRPIRISFTKAEIEKLFKRRV